MAVVWWRISDLQIVSVFKGTGDLFESFKTTFRYLQCIVLIVILWRVGLSRGKVGSRNQNRRRKEEETLDFCSASWLKGVKLRAGFCFVWIDPGITEISFVF